MSLEPRRKIKVLVLIEVEVSEGWRVETSPTGPVLIGPNGGTSSWQPSVVAGYIERTLRERFPRTAGAWWPWGVRSAKEAIAP